MHALQVFFTFVVSSSIVRFIRRFPTDFVKLNKSLSLGRCMRT